jgi:hypothetical protein
MDKLLKTTSIALAPNVGQIKNILDTLTKKSAISKYDWVRL